MKKHTAYFGFLFLVAFLISSEVRAEYDRVMSGAWGGGLDSSAPTITDLDNDGLIDLLIGESSGKIYHYEQDSSGSLNFTLVTESFNSIDVGSRSVSAATDLDGDGLIDLLIGESSGNINHYEQNSSGSLSFTLVTESFNSIAVGSRSAPASTDLDADGLIDLLIGESSGNINHYEQDSSGSSSFTLVTESFNSIAIGSSLVPAATDLDGDGLIDILIGELSGNLNLYEQDSSGSLSFTLVTESFNGIDVGSRSIPATTDLDGDGLIDLLIGELSGNLNLYEQGSSGSTSFTLVTESFNHIDLDDDSKPIATDLDGDGLIDLLVGNNDSHINHYEQDSSGSTSFSLITEDFNSIVLANSVAPTTTDLNDDGLLDLLIGFSDGTILHYEQNASDPTVFDLVTESFSSINVTENAVPTTTDLDGDGLIDLLIGKGSGTLSHYEQESLGSTTFNLVTESFNSINVGPYSVPAARDLDGDGLIDLLVGNSNGGLQHYEQDSSNSTTFSLITESFENMTDLSLSPTTADVDGDGGVDIFFGHSAGGIFLYLKVVCGDSSIEGAEICDDGNTADGDGCGASCQTESTWYADSDADGYGNASITQLATSQPSGYVTDSTDCNDSLATAYPGATEACGDSTDQDCDGSDIACAVSDDTDTDGGDDISATDDSSSSGDTTNDSASANTATTSSGGCALQTANASDKSIIALMALIFLYYLSRSVLLKNKCLT